MTTFTLQDLTETPEEKEAMDMLAIKNAVSDFVVNNHVENSSTTNQTIQGATGAQYTPIDLKQFHKPIEEINKPNIHALAQQLTESFALLIKAIAELQAEDKQPVSSSTPDLHATIDTVLSQADWLYAKLGDAMDSRYDMKDLIEEGMHDTISERVSTEVEDHFQYHFNLADHVDIEELVREAVEAKMENISISFD